MAFTTTTLASACALTDKFIKVTSATGFAAGNLVLVEQEFMQVTKDYVSGTSVNVIRGQQGSVTAAHVALANVTTGLASDFSAASPQTFVTEPTVRPVLFSSYGATGTMTLPPAGCDMRVALYGSAAITLTVPVPTKDMDFCKVEFITSSNFAHILSFTGGLGGAGSNYVKWTNNSTAPSGFTVMACNGLWVGITCTPAAGTVTNITGTVSA